MDLSSLFLPLLLVLLAVPLFLSARKQKKAAAEQHALLKSLQPGDRVMTTSGLFATVVDASDDDRIDLEIADGVVTTWLRPAIREKVVDTAEETDAVVDDVEDEAVADAPVAGTTAPVTEPVQQDSKK